MQRAVILNPMSGNYPLKQIKKHLKDGFNDCKVFEVSETSSPESIANELVKKGVKEIIVCGGDGTIKDVVSALIDTDVKLGIIPTGTGNMLAANLGIPQSIEGAIRIINEGHSCEIDIGKLNNRYFTFMAGCGFSSTIIEQATREKKEKLGFWAYFLEGIKHGIFPQYSKFKIKLDGKKRIGVKALTVIAANKANIIGETFSLAPQASFFDGEMDLIVISVLKPTDYIYALWCIFTKQHFHRSSRIKYYRFKKAEISSVPKLSVQIDGDIMEKTPFTVEVLPKAISIFTNGNLK